MAVVPTDTTRFVLSLRVVIVDTPPALMARATVTAADIQQPDQESSIIAEWSIAVILDKRCSAIF
jgi:hypothetical protein